MTWAKPSQRLKKHKKTFLIYKTVALYVLHLLENKFLSLANGIIVGMNLK